MSKYNKPDIHKMTISGGRKISFRYLEATDVKKVANIHRVCFYNQYWSNNRTVLANPTVDKKTGEQLSDRLDDKYYENYWASLYFKTKRENSKHFAIVVEVERENGEKEIIGFSKNQIEEKQDVIINKTRPDLFCDNQMVANFQSQYYIPEFRDQGIGTVHNAIRAKIFQKHGCKKGFSIAAPTNRSVDFMQKQGGIHAGFIDFSVKDIFNTDFEDSDKIMIPITSFVYPDVEKMASKSPVNQAAKTKTFYANVR